MKRRILGLTCGLAAILAAALAVGCGRDASGPEAGGIAAARAAPVAEGAVVRTTVRDALLVPGQGSAAVRELGVTPAEAVVVGGRAVDERCGALLAVVAGRGRGRELRHTDAEGHAHRLVIETLDAGPMTSARYERDGEVLAEVAFRWEPRDGGYVMRERVLSLYRNGSVVLRQVRQGADPEVTAAAAPAGGAALDVRPPVLPAQALPDCTEEWAVYIGASAAMIVAGEIFTLVPNPATAGALLTAVNAWERSLNNLLACQIRSVTPSGGAR
jgi:hypothetical protein